MGKSVRLRPVPRSNPHQRVLPDARYLLAFTAISVGPVICLSGWRLCLILLAFPMLLVADEKTELIETQRFAEGNAENGAPIYKRYCKGCHGKDGRGGAHTFMPHVHNLTKKDYIELVPDGFLYTVIAEGGEAVGKNSYMPAWKNTLSTEQIKDVIAYIRTMPTY